MTFFSQLGLKYHGGHSSSHSKTRRSPRSSVSEISAIPERDVSSGNITGQASEESTDLARGIPAFPPSRSSTTSDTSASSNGSQSRLSSEYVNGRTSTEFEQSLHSGNHRSLGENGEIQDRQSSTSSVPFLSSSATTFPMSMSTSPTPTNQTSSATTTSLPRPTSLGHEQEAMVQLNRHYRMIPDAYTIPSCDGATVGCLGYGTPRPTVADEDFGPPPAYDSPPYGTSSRKKNDKRRPFRH